MIPIPYSWQNNPYAAQVFDPQYKTKLGNGSNWKEINTQIMKAGAQNNFSLACQLFQEAIALAPRNLYHYNFFIQAAIRCSEYTEAKKVYEFTVQHGLCNHHTHRLLVQIPKEYR